MKNLYSSQFNYRLSIPEPENHLLEVELAIADWQAEFIDLKLPVWTPGSYLVREYAKHLQDFEATDASGTPLSWQKISKNHWQVKCAINSDHPNNSIINSTIKIRYRIFCNELTVRTNHIDRTHAFLTGAAVFMYVTEHQQQPYTVEIGEIKDNWQIATALPALENATLTFYAKDFDTLVDSPFEIGMHQRYEFTVLDKPHSFVVWGQHNADMQRIVKDTAAIVAVEAEIFGGLPYDRYDFILHTSNGFGGLEHKNSTVLLYNRLGFRKEESYLQFMNLVAHEFFHTWNVKRIRPKALEKFDYDNENYTSSLWFSEGTTSYYDQIFPLRAGLYDAKHYLKLVSKAITRLQTTFGRNVQSLYDSSFDTWIKLYRPDPNTHNNQISYYLKGELVSLLLDLLIRSKTNNLRSLDRVMQIMWERFGKEEIGFSEAELHEVIETVAGVDLSNFWNDYLYGTKELDYNYYLEPFGLELRTSRQDIPFTGMTLKTKNGLAEIEKVEFGSPAQKAGLSTGDLVIAIAGIRVTAENFSDRLRDYTSGETITVTTFQQDLLHTVEVTVQDPICNHFDLVQITNPSPNQELNLRLWLSIEP
ncbi:M61 family metallopeptidase [Pseudanabaena galeata UHCC 0370]|uniref:M61 family metallopeptidase n=1 Tax=Pseudanabaena galeata UHCC 0370 TaxID=3110310 RepID=A0ABU5TF27_9CYAN|nr:M61 family metallopeptidase [Pseudanabaena galeata]MEA5476875.1 M61 family metallopeptidase [Pseudanabaena galeata UHCC 0370]